jgi:hypothetical protein
MLSDIMSTKSVSPIGAITLLSHGLSCISLGMILGLDRWMLYSRWVSM